MRPFASAIKTGESLLFREEQSGRIRGRDRGRVLGFLFFSQNHESLQEIVIPNGSIVRNLLLAQAQELSFSIAVSPARSWDAA